MRQVCKKITVKVLSVIMILSLLMPAYTYGSEKSPEAMQTDYEIALELPLADNTEDAKVVIAVEGKTKEELQSLIADNKITLSLIRNENRDYLDKELFPNQYGGGSLNQWKTQNKSDMFTELEYEADEKDGKVFLNITMDVSCYFYDRSGNVDTSVPHSNGGAYMDMCGYFDLIAFAGEENLGYADVKIVPYEGFHTMDEIYSGIKEVVEEGKENGLYAEEFSMGKSTGGRNMPYMIIAKDKDTVKEWLEFTEIAEKDPDKALKMIESGEADDIKVPLMYSNIHANEVAAADGIMNFAKMIVKNEKISYDKLTGFTEEGQSQLEKEMAQNNTAVPDLVKDDVTYLGYIQAGNGKSGSVDLGKYYEIDTDEVMVSELLEDVFFILVPEENVDGRTYVTRAADNGYDLNRDNSFQTTAETSNMQKLIGTFNPVSLTELHGRVTDFQCEPCSPPHEPNFEYDLLARNLMKGGESFGIAAVANNEGYNSYVIPQRDYLTYTGETNDDGTPQTYWEYPWDDMSTSYTPQFAMLQGTVAYTVELPAYNSDTVLAASYGILGQADYISEAKIDYIKAQTEIYKRGATNYNSNSFEEVGKWFCDQYDIEGAEAELFRPEYDGEGENGNFYPECYIIPMDSENQVNIASAADMLVLLARNDVKINIAEKPFTYNGVEYPEGTAIISMYQAKRSVANGLLYDGTLIQSWSELYSEGITAFNETRGFDMLTVADVNAYKEISKVEGKDMAYDETVDYAASLGTSFKGIENADVIIDNTSEESASAVNSILKNGGVIAMITEGENKGDFICSYSEYLKIKDEYLIEATGVYGDEYEALIITKSPSVYLTGAPSDSGSGYVQTGRITSSSWNYDRAAMELMNFTVTGDISEADIVAGSSALKGDALLTVQSGTPYIGYGANTNSLNSIFGDSFARTSIKGAMDCLGYVVYPSETLTNASYIAEEDYILYGYGVGYFTAVPEGAKVIVQMDGTKSPLEGFIPTYDKESAEKYEEYINGSIQGFEYKGTDVAGNNIDVAVFANTLTNKVHQRDEYSYISNFIFSKYLGTEYDGISAPKGSEEGSNDTTEQNGLENGNAGETQNEMPKTGDESGILLWITVLAAALMVIVAVVNKKDKKE